MPSRIAAILVAIALTSLLSCGKKNTASGDEHSEVVAVGWQTDTGSQSGDDTLFEPVDGIDDPTPEVVVLDDGLVLVPDVVTAPDSIEPSDVMTGPDQSQPGTCVDKDGDGYGTNCYLGQDCDDGNSHFNVYCPPCETQTQEGCPCTQQGLVEICFEGDPATVGVGPCQLGQRQCSGGFWSSCIGQVLPQPEGCDDIDNDCDGDVDEGVLSPCGDCDPFCDTLEIGPDGYEGFNPTPDNSEKIGKNLDGYLTLDSQQIDLAFMWVANSSENTVSRLNTEQCVESGRYAVCSNPSRTAVDLLGNVWVGCRSDGGVVKIAIDEALCIDKNPPEGIQTAKDLNGDGKVTGGEVLPKGQDECVLFTVYPGGSCQRGLGVDSENYAWVGEWNAKKLRRLHPDDGQVVKEISISANPYGLVIDQAGTIWVSGRGGNRLLEVDPELGEVGSYTSTTGCFQPYGIGLDYKGRVWIGNCCCDDAGIRYDPVTKTWAKAQVHGRPRGIAGSQDGNIYVANDTSSEVAIVDSDTMVTLGFMSAGSGRFPIGMTVDFAGNVWTANQSAASATKFDPETKQVLCEVPVGSGPYTYSDMTGYALHNFTAPQGHYAHVFGGWEGFRVKWTAVYVDVDYQDPENCFVKVRVRTGQDPDDLATKPWQGYYGPYPPDNFPLDLLSVPDMDGPLLEVEVTLHSQSKTCTPLVKSIEAKFASD
jgi:DNA-binding beta-propeller fold protein YncE